jgi:GNAT superfamily N-acetyltransferase
MRKTLEAELDDFYGVTSPDSPAAQRANQVQAALFGHPAAGHALLAWDGSTLAGLYLKELYVAAAYRRNGTGRMLMERLLQIARERGCTRVEWTADTSNAGAQSFYTPSASRRWHPRSSTA